MRTAWIYQDHRTNPPRVHRRPALYHSRANSNTNRILKAASFLYALIELVQEKGI